LEEKSKVQSEQSQQSLSEPRQESIETYQLASQEECQKEFQNQNPISEPSHIQEIIDLDTLPTKSRKYGTTKKITITYCNRHGKASTSSSGTFILDKQYTTSELYDTLVALKYPQDELRHLKSGAWITNVMIKSFLSSRHIDYTYQTDGTLKNGNEFYRKQALMIYHSNNHFSVVEFNHQEKKFVFYDALQSHDVRTMQQYFQDYEVGNHYWSSN